MAEERVVERVRDDVLMPGEWLPRRLFDWMWSDWPKWPAVRGFETEMRIEEFVEGDELVVRAEMPGIDPDKDVQVHVRDHVLEIRAERREETEETEKGRYRTEFRYGSFSRVVPLPPDATEQDVKASYKDGILEVRMPVDKKQADVTKIEVQRG